MEKVYKISLALYTVIVGLLIPITLILKASSFNRDYYPTSFILFIALLIGIFLTTSSVQILKNATSSLKKILTVTSSIFILVGVILQLVGSFELFKETISSLGDIIVAIIYIVLTILGLISLFALHRISTK
jgi:predicted Na+-dependent transporter